MYRKALTDLEIWNKSKNRKPLIIWGARQVGTTYLVKDLFAEKHYCNSYLYIDFRVEDETRDYCSKHVSASDIVEFISAVKNTRINENTLLIFDEIQECPGIITALKYFCQDKREIPVIATGSMVRIKLQRLSRKRGIKDEKPFLFPVGKINQITLYPMSFDEYLINRNKILYNSICKAYEQKQPLPEALHKLALDEVYKYLLVGGMPEAIAAFAENGSYFESRRVLIDLYDNYLSDMELYQASPESIIRSRKIFSSIYAELNRESKNFKSGLIESGAKTRDMRTPIDWLTTAHVVHQSYQLNEDITTPLISNNDSTFRLFLCDVGMFAYQSGINSASFISSDADNTLSGIFFENYIANELASRGIKLYYWCGKRNSEIEFIVESGAKVYPIDVKKGRGSLHSLEKFAYHNSFETAIKVSANNFGDNTEKKLLTVPLYMFFLVADDLASGTALIDN